MTRVSVIVPSWNTRELLRSCLCSLEPALPESSEVIVVDNGSMDGSAAMVAREFRQVKLLRNERNLGFAHAVNQGLERTRGEYALVLHTDAEIGPQPLREMVQYLDANERYGAVAPRILDPDGNPQRAFYGLPRPIVTPLAQALARVRPASRELRRLRQDQFDPESEADVDGASTACLLLRRRALRKNQPLDEALDFHFVDVDLCDRLRVHGWRIRYTTSATVYHHGGRSAAQLEDSEERWHASRIAYWRKHYGAWGATWVKACTAVGFTDHLLGELWRRANGCEELPLGPAYRLLADCLKA